MTDLSLVIKTYPFPKLTIIKSKSEFDIFSINYRAINHEAIIKKMEEFPESKKDVNLSDAFRQKGNEHFQAFKYDAAFDCYYQSVGVAPVDTLQYGIALANRSAALFVNKNYEDCLKDIENVLNAKYPEHKLGKLYIRQTECYLNLNQNIKAIQSWAIACEHFEKFKNIAESPANIDQVTRKMLNIIRQYELSDLEISDEISPKFELKGGENAKFLNASNMVELKHNAKSGRHIIAKTDIEPGDILLAEEPYCAVRNNGKKISRSYCSNCFSLCMATIPCKMCSVHFYCSEHCRQVSWDTTHKWECSCERRKLFNSKLRLILNILLKASNNNFKTIIEDKSTYGNKEDNFPFVNKLITNKNEMTCDELTLHVKCAIIIVIYLKQYTGYFEWLREKPENTDKSLSFLYESVGGRLLQLCMQVNCNDTEIVHTTLTYANTPTIDVKFLGFGLYVSCSMLNHSCNPNTLVTYEKTLKIVRARDKIPKNTEITVDYNKYASEKITGYGKYLLEKYKFNCPCAKCRNPGQNDENPWLCKKCQGKAFTVQNQSYVRCINPTCKHIFNISKYRSFDQNLTGKLMEACLTGNYAAFVNVHNQYLKIHHRDNAHFIAVYLTGYEFFFKHRAMEGCVNICKLFMQYCEQFSEVNDVKVLLYIRLMVALMWYNKLMRNNKVPVRENVMDEIHSTLNETKRILSFYLPSHVIKEYEQYAIKFINEP